MQTTFLRFWLYLERKQEIQNPRAFLYRIAHNLIVDDVRKKKMVSLDQLLEVGFEPTIDTWNVTHSQLDAEKPLKKLGKMCATYKDVLRQRFLRGLSPADIAKMTGETSNTVSVRIFRGLKHLRALLEEAPLVTVPVRAVRQEFEVIKTMVTLHSGFYWCRER